MAVGTIAPATAAPFASPRAPEAASKIIKVQDNVEVWRRIIQGDDRDRRWDRDRRPDRDRDWDRDRRWDRDRDRWDRDRDRFDRRDGFVYWRGHRGFRDRRPGYREYNGWWFPPAAFALGAIVGGAMSQQAVRPSGNAHVEWCYSRYRSYRAADNTFQPYNGPRRQCISPYG